ncbi:hypothetical protein PZ895_02205 [Mesorhizobium sp. YIM 152430]|uniref:hypothetical protein n=1 Tax=Mesorhizobium sp. YIM 152430 TaxID=3031761 RepID=UPI0023DA46AE|nr:hypothetical protein [Mesorhizobium sp. YIM 152430]MDF1598587.1 hypothetical protein [Mesorhizobium sp. YIM 152430]
MFPQPDLRSVRRAPDDRNLACGLTASAIAALLALPAIVMAGAARAGVGSSTSTPYMRVAEHGALAGAAVLDHHTTESFHHVPLV